MRQKISAVVLRLAVILLFLICLLLVLFFANGYSFDLLSREFRKTGGLAFDFTDKQAKVYLDGKLLNGNLPFVASNILPGKYNVVVTREGYTSWQDQFVVKPDLVNRVDQIYLLPSDLIATAKILLNETSKGKNYFLRKNYLFTIEDRHLTFNRLDNYLNKFKPTVLVLPQNGLTNLEIINNRALLSFNDQQRYWLDLNSGILEKIVLSNAYAAAADKWIYFKDKNLAVFDLRVDRIIWSGEFHDLNINSVEDSWVNGKEFLKIGFIGSSKYGLYQFKDNQLIKLFDDIQNGPFWSEQKGWIVLSAKKELWQLDFNTDSKKQVLIQRLSKPTRLYGYAPDGKSLLIAYGDKIILTDFDFKNTFDLLESVNVLSLLISEDKQIYVLESMTSDLPEKMSVALKQYDWPVY